MCQKTQFFHLYKICQYCYLYGHLLYVFISMDKNLQFIEIIFESYPCQEKKINLWQFFTCSYKFVSSISGVLEGRDYNPGLSLNRWMFESLWRLYWDEFVKWTKVEDCEWRLDILNNRVEELHSESESSNTLEDDQISNKL